MKKLDISKLSEASNEVFVCLHKEQVLSIT